MPDPDPKKNMQKCDQFYPTSPPGPPTNQAVSQGQHPKRNMVHYALSERGRGRHEPQAPGEHAETPRILSNQSPRPTRSIRRTH